MIKQTNAGKPHLSRVMDTGQATGKGMRMPSSKLSKPTYGWLASWATAGFLVSGMWTAACDSSVHVADLHVCKRTSPDCVVIAGISTWKGRLLMWSSVRLMSYVELIERVFYHMGICAFALCAGHGGHCRTTLGEVNIGKNTGPGTWLKMGVFACFEDSFALGCTTRLSTTWWTVWNSRQMLFEVMGSEPRCVPCILFIDTTRLLWLVKLGLCKGIVSRNTWMQC